MSTASNPFLQGSPALAATTLRPMRAATLPRTRSWPEPLAAAGFAAVLAASLALRGAPVPMAIAALSFAMFCLGAMLSISSTQPETQPNPYLRGILLLGTLVVAVPFAQSTAALFSPWPIGSATPRDSLLEGAKLASFLVLFAGLRHCLTTAHSARRGAMILLGAIAALASLSLLRFDPDLRPLTHPGLTGPFENRSAFAALMGIGLCISAAFATQPAHPRAHRPVFWLFRTTCVLACAVLIVAIVHSQSRLGLVSSILGVGMIMVFRMRRGWLTSTLAAGLGGAALLAFADPDVLNRFASLPKDLEVRLALYAQVSELALVSPLWGQGAGSFAMVFEHFQKPPVTSAFVWDYAHSTLLSAAVELGVPATLAIAGLITLAFTALIRRFRSTGEAPALAGAAALALACPHWLADFSFEIPALPLFLIALVALGLGPKSLPKKDDA